VQTHQLAKVMNEKKPWCRQDNTPMEIRFEGVDCIQLEQDRVEQWILVNTAINIQVQNFSTS
jgi:hypothetical protein